MPDSPADQDFLNQLTSLVEENIAHEQFGVTELADAMNMSRSNLLRKVKKITNLSVSQMIREIRLKRGMHLLRNSSSNVSEVSHQVGFGSTSYFIKCFREYYGYPPGEAAKRQFEEVEPKPLVQPANNRKVWILSGAALLIALAIGLFFYYRAASPSPGLERSIVVLPFKNDSNDSTNVYFINGLMESTLNDLQKIEDLRVISRTSAEKYRNTSRSIPEMAEELNVNYFVEGSGQKIGDEILLNIQLIEGPTDKHLWSQQYRRKTSDIFQLQQDVAKNIAEEIRAVITPEEEKRIAQIPTRNLEAYDQFVRGRELLYESSRASLLKSIEFFKKAIELDKEFALAYGYLTMTYYYLDLYQIQKTFAAEIGESADKAWLYDPKLAESLVAKALFYMHKKEYAQAAPYLEKALEYNPNSGLTIRFLAELYNMYIPNTVKYLEYSLKGVRIDAGSGDSLTISHNYMNLANAFIQGGFIDEALECVEKSLAYNPKNRFSPWVKLGILYARDRDLVKSTNGLIEQFEKDTTQFYIAQEIAKAFYYRRDNKTAYKYYRSFLNFLQVNHLDVARKSESLKIGIVFSSQGRKKESEEYFKMFKEYADSDKTIYKDVNLMGYYAWEGNDQKALEHFRSFSKQDNIQYWVLFLKDDPIFDHLKELPEFKKIMTDLETRFWTNHAKVRKDLQDKGLL